MSQPEKPPARILILCNPALTPAQALFLAYLAAIEAETKASRLPELADLAAEIEN